MKKQAIITQRIKNLKNQQNKPNWHEQNPNSEHYIQGKPIAYLEIDSKFDNVEKGVKSSLKDIRLDDENKKLVLTKEDDSTSDVDITKIYDKDIKSIALDSDNKLVLTKEDDSNINVDISSLDVTIDTVTFDKDTNDITITDNKSNSKTVNISGNEIKNKWLSDVISYKNDWEDHSSTWRPYIYKNREGMVIIRGLITGGDNDTLVGTLPDEYKPFTHIMCNSIVSNSHYQRVDVRDNGDINVTNEGTRDDTSWLNLDFCYQTKAP